MGDWVGGVKGKRMGRGVPGATVGLRSMAVDISGVAVERIELRLGVGLMVKRGMRVRLRPILAKPLPTLG